MTDLILQVNEISFKRLEEEVYQWGCRIACKYMEELLKKLDQEIKEARDKSKYRDKGFKYTSIKMLMGEVPYRRTIYKVVGEEKPGKKFIRLLDEELGLDNVGLISANLAERIVENACKVSYKDSAKNISDLTGQTISHTGVWNVIQKLGAKVEDMEEQEVKLYKSEQLQGDREVKVLFEEADGVYVRMQGKDAKKSKKKEMKVAMFHEGWERKGKDRYELFNKTVICGGFEKVKKLSDKKEARIARIYNSDEIEMRFCNSDGGGWIKTLYDYDAESYHQLDGFHINQEIVRSISEKEMKKKITKLYEDQEFEKMFMWIDAYGNSITNEKEEKRVRKLEGYLRNNEEGLIPYQKKGLKMPELPEGLEYRGMGACEHNVYLTIAKRMKHKGASWSEKGATNLGKLLALTVSKDLSNTLDMVTKAVLPEPITREIVSVLSASKAPMYDGKGYEGIVSSRPFANAFKTNGRASIDGMFDLRPFSEIKYR